MRSASKTSMVSADRGMSIVGCSGSSTSMSAGPAVPAGQPGELVSQGPYRIPWREAHARHPGGVGEVGEVTLRDHPGLGRTSPASGVMVVGVSGAAPRAGMGPAPSRQRPPSRRNTKYAGDGLLPGRRTSRRRQAGSPRLAGRGGIAVRELGGRSGSPHRHDRPASSPPTWSALRRRRSPPASRPGRAGRAAGMPVRPSPCRRCGRPPERRPDPRVAPPWRRPGCRNRPPRDGQADEEDEQSKRHRRTPRVVAVC